MPPHPRGSILVVEDDRLVANDLRDRLIDLGYEVPHLACTGHEAIDIAGKQHFDLVLMDIRLKGKLDGIDTAAHLSGRYNLPVVFLSAHADDATVARASAIHPFGYLVKPVREADLKATLEVAVNKSRADLAVSQREQWYAGTLRSLFEQALRTGK